MDRLAIRALAPRHGGRAVPQLMDSQRIQQVRDIVVTEKGLAAFASRKEAQAIAPQINVINSTIGQLALGNIHNVTMTTILDAVETSIDSVDAAPEAKEEPEARCGGCVRRRRQSRAPPRRESLRLRFGTVSVFRKRVEKAVRRSDPCRPRDLGWTFPDGT